MAQYMLLLYSDPTTWTKLSPEEMQKAIQKYMDWGSKLSGNGILLGSHKLAGDVGKVMRSRAGQTRVTDGPYSETKEVLGGYFLIEAASYDAAVEACRDCPQLEYGGTIEVRVVDAMPK